MSETYQAKDIDPEIDSLVTQTQAALSLAKQANDKLAVKDARIVELEGQLKESHSEKVELEKVASARTETIKNKINQTVDHMVAKEVILESFREKIASELIADPYAAIDMLDRVLNFNVQEVSTPRGESIEKTASTQTPDPGQSASEWIEGRG